MRRFLLGALVAMVVGGGLGAALDKSRAGLLMDPTSGGGGGGCAAATAWLARNGNDHPTDFTTMICGLVTDGTWAIGDALYIYAATTSTPALLNLISTSFSSTSHGSPTFTANAGFTGVNASSTVYIDTGYNPSTAGGHYTQNSASLMAWSLTNVQASSTGGTAVGADNAGFTQIDQLDLWSSTNTLNAYVNIGNAGQPFVTANVSTALGSWIANRSGSNALEGYHNGSAITLSGPSTSSVPVNLNFYTLSLNVNGAPAAGGVPNQIAAIWVGGSLDATHALSLHNRVCTYLTSVHGSC